MIRDEELGRILSMLKSDFPLMASEPEAFVGRLADVAPEFSFQDVSCKRRTGKTENRI